MYKIFSLAFIFLSSICFSQPLYFSFPFSLSGSGNMHPRVAMVNEDPLLVWGHPSSGDNLYYSTWNGNGFNAPGQLTHNGETVMLGYAEGAVMLTHNNDVYVCYVSMGSFEHRVYLRKSIDGGQTFSDTILVNDRNNGYSLEFANMTLDDSGNPIVVFIRNEIGDVPKQVVYYSTDGGNTFSSEINGTPDMITQPCECCPAAISANGNNIYLSYRNNDANIRDFYVSASRDAGLSFDTLFRIDNSAWYSNSCPVSGASSVISGDSLFSIYTTKYNNRFGVKATSIHKSNFNQGVERFVDANFTSANYQMNYPEAAGSGDTLGIIWQDNRNGQYAIYFSYTTAGLNNLSEPVLVSDFISGVQLNPHIAFKKGVFHVTWRDYSNDLIWYRKLSFNADVLKTDEMAGATFSFYPNPADDYVQIVNPANELLKIELLDMNGRIVFSSKSQWAEKINTESLQPGVYLLKINSATSLLSKKLIIQ